jgi:hypothetical protein
MEGKGFPPEPILTRFIGKNFNLTRPPKGSLYLSTPTFFIQLIEIINIF